MCGTGLCQTTDCIPGFHRLRLFPSGRYDGGVRALPLGLALIGAVAVAQEPLPQDYVQAMQAMGRAEISIEVREHSMGPDDVIITALTEGYPQDLLRRQCEMVGQLSGGGVRGLRVGEHVISARAEQGFVRAMFGTEHVIDRASGRLNLEALVKPFAGTDAPFTVNVLAISFPGETPTEKILKTYSNSGVDLIGHAMESPPAIEYRVKLKTQNPDLVSIPLDAQAAESTATGQEPQEPAAPMPMWLFLTIIIAGAIALGALVYFAVLRLPRRGTRR